MSDRFSRVRVRAIIPLLNYIREYDDCFRYGDDPSATVRVGTYTDYEGRWDVLRRVPMKVIGSCLRRGYITFEVDISVLAGWTDYHITPAGLAYLKSLEKVKVED